MSNPRKASMDTTRPDGTFFISVDIVSSPLVL